jgi:hypothetical protein
MIARVWHGSTKPEHADAYESHLKPELLPGLSQRKRFRGSYLLRRAVGDETNSSPSSCGIRSTTFAQSRNETMRKP